LSVSETWLKSIFRAVVAQALVSSWKRRRLKAYWVLFRGSWSGCLLRLVIVSGAHYRALFSVCHGTVKRHVPRLLELPSPFPITFPLPAQTTHRGHSPLRINHRKSPCHFFGIRPGEPTLALVHSEISRSSDARHKLLEQLGYHRPPHRLRAHAVPCPE
jgi:hypothetical protein